MNQDISLIICSCDKYESTWRPFFELLLIYWNNHPEKIYLISETISYEHKSNRGSLDIISCTYGKECAWSDRLINTLKIVDTKYFILMMDDFFLLGNVKEDIIQKCYLWMEGDPKIAGIRLWGQNSDKLVPSVYGDFYVTEKNKPYRVDAQAALWNKNVFLKFVSPGEDPWKYEQNSSIRSSTTDYTILWHYIEHDDDPTIRVIPYDFRAINGYGITWGHWLWNNKIWFEKNGISDVDFKTLGCLSQKTVMRRIKYLYKPNRTFFEKFIGIFIGISLKIRKLHDLGIKGAIKKIKDKKAE